LFISKAKLESFRNSEKITKNLVTELIDILKNNDTGRSIINNIIINDRILARAYLFMAYLYNLKFKLLPEEIRLLRDDEFTKYLLEYVNKVEEIKSKGKNEYTDKLNTILEYNFKKNIKDHVKSIFNRYKIEKNMVTKEYRQKFLSKEY
jgi:hypothetical protein